MRAHLADFLNDVEARPDSPEAGVAHRAAGTTCWFAGEYREARIISSERSITDKALAGIQLSHPLIFHTTENV